MRFSRTLKLAGAALLGVVGLQVGLDRHLQWGPSVALWLGAFAAFAGAFLYGAAAAEGDRSRRLAALGMMVPAMLAMASTLPCHFGSLTLVVVASQAALVLSPTQLAGLVSAQSLALGVFLVADEDVGTGLATMSVLVAGQSFAAFAVHAARREAEAGDALSRANAELRATRALLEEASRVNERTRIARELHDVLGHDLTALGLQLEVASHVPPERAATHVAKAQEVSGRLLKNVRDVVGAMREAPPADLAGALRSLVADVPGLAVHLELPPSLRVDDGARAHCILRCVQEIVTNALRHAGAQNLWVRIAQEDDAITVDARDDGRGAQELRAGHGLAGMRSRLEELGGWLRVAPEPARPFAVSAWLPGRERS